MSAVVLAFDGVIADTNALRVNALCSAAQAEGIVIETARATVALPARTFYECGKLLTPTADETTRDLMALRAHQYYAARVAQGVDLVATALQTLRTAQQTGARIVLRADSNRSDVDRVLRQWELDLAFTIVRCADDLPRWPNMSSIESSYRAISARLDSLRVSGERRAFEPSPIGVQVARSVLGIADMFV